ncbi:MAG TPA: hypothetical protein VLA00_18160 [Xanthobacteraceae bacterium]|nr:hypothetical protein [Xanthobacteraceae bacterium]
MLNPFSLFTLGVDMARLAGEAQSVMALRIARLSTGDSDSGTEVARMVIEKAMALGEVNMRLASAAIQGTLDDAAHDVVAMYRNKVRANQLRLSR